MKTIYQNPIRSFMQVKINVAILVMFIFSFSATETKSQDIKKAWKQALKGCGKSDMFGRETLFFGPSNSIGLGSVWRRTDDKGYNPRFELSDMIPDELARNKIIKPGTKSEQCSKSKNVAWSSTISLPFMSNIFGSDGVGVDLHRARKMSISVDNLALDVLKELPFEQALKSIVEKNPKDPYVDDLLSNSDRLLVTKAYRLTGLSVTLDYDPKLLDSLKAKYANASSIKIGGDKGLNINLSFTSNSQITIKLPTDVYIAGEFSKISSNGTINLNNSKQFALRLTPVKIDDSALLGHLETLKLENPNK